jgi:hypothetical protein
LIVENDTACDRYTWNGITYTASTTQPTISYTSADGCDSVINLHLVINYSIHDTIVDTAVGSYVWNGHTYTNSGQYLFAGTTEAGCDSMVTLILTITSQSVPDVIGEALNIYPNPTTGWITIENESVLKVEVYDFAGRKVATAYNSNRIDLTRLPSGTYALRIELPQGYTVRKVVKK